MTPLELERATRELRRRRAAILQAKRQAGAEHDGLLDAEHGQELEEAAQAEQGLVDLERLSAAERLELIRIEAALARIDEGGYGTCAELRRGHRAQAAGGAALGGALRRLRDGAREARRCRASRPVPECPE